MRALVTGADGFAGTHLVRCLRRAGHTVTGAVFGRAAAAHEVRVDLTSQSELARLPDDIDVVVHAAGLVDTSASPDRMFAVNLTGTRNLLAWCQQRRVRHLVHLSTVAVYGPLVLGEGRSERTPRLGLGAGFAYMRSKAWAERAVEQSGVPYSLLRPPAIIGAGDTIISRGFADALGGPGLPLLRHARPDRRVSLAFAEGLAEVARRALEKGPLCGAVHVVDAELSFAELARMYARALGQSCAFSRISWPDVARRHGDAGFQWLVASTRFGQHYSRRKLLRELDYTSALSLETAVSASVSSLQALGVRLF
jgi:nucleoside-diphosphate-sugar epimerase